ncbi:MAG: DNA methyltransferase [Candidatus Berkelbacteria bacterium]|nr:DNA methyltransferase [Candidatus Berkelbacteria bacterium]
MIRAFNEDCMEAMKDMPDKAFKLAIVDPEFGISIGRSARLVTDKGKPAKAWDDKQISPDYFKELFRVSINQIIWGGNYYSLPPTKHCIVWDKRQPEKLSFGMFDFAWTSFSTANKMFRQSVTIEGNGFHPTQKPVRLYEWLLKNYAKPGDKILDTHGGSFSSAIACDIMGYDLDIFEIDRGYFEAGQARLTAHQRQGVLDFQGVETP